MSTTGLGPPILTTHLPPAATAYWDNLVTLILSRWKKYPGAKWVPTPIPSSSRTLNSDNGWRPGRLAPGL